MARKPETSRSIELFVAYMENDKTMDMPLLVHLLEDGSREELVSLIPSV